LEAQSSGLAADDDVVPQEVHVAMVGDGVIKTMTGRFMGQEVEML